MAVDLLKPVLSNRTRSINFFNGRLLAGEDLTTEQKANRVAHSLLGQAIGDGVVYGLEVKESAQSSTTLSPVLAVTQGLAVNQNGACLLLDTDTEVALVRPANGSNGSGNSSSIFQECTPTQTGAYIAGAGVYLLTIGPANASQGLAEVNGVSTTQARCNTKYNVQGVQFRLISIDLTDAELDDTNHLRNLVAYKCFGVAQETAFVTDPFNTPLTSYGLLDDLRSQQALTKCEVPLAVLYWTATSGVVFVDMWAVRRPVFPQAATEMWAPVASRRRMAEGLAMFFQFQEQIDEMVISGTNPSWAVRATENFRYLPAAGFLPIAQGGVNGFTVDAFFEPVIHRDPEFFDGSLLHWLLKSSVEYAPVDLESSEMVRLYKTWQSEKAIAEGASAQNYVVFTSPHVPYLATARFDVARWDYSNYAECCAVST